VSKSLSILVVLLVFAFICFNVSRDNNSVLGQNQSSDAPKPKWEYKIVETSTKNQELEKAIADANNDGWELIGLVSNVSSDGNLSVRKGDSFGRFSVSTSVKIVLKREKL
jgi:hypothetical protein